MHLVMNVFITHNRAKNLQNRMDVFKYTLASYAVIPWEHIYLFVELDTEFKSQQEELAEYITTLFGHENLSLVWQRYTFQNEWKGFMEELCDEERLVWFTQNDDHIFMDRDLDVLNEGLQHLENDTNNFKSLYFSHWPEVVKLSGKLGTQERVGKSYVRFQATVCDSVQIMNTALLRYLFLQLDWGGKRLIKIDDLLTQKEIVSMTCGVHSTSERLQSIYVPLREMCRHLEGSLHIEMPYDVAHPFTVPPGFHKGDLRVRCGYPDRKDNWVNLNTRSEIYSLECPNGVDYNFTYDEIPLFWRRRIKEIDVNPETMDRTWPEREQIIKDRLTVHHSSLWTRGNNFRIPKEWLQTAVEIAKPTRKLTVISHIYNEEYMLPFWLSHHKQMFDHGIMIDYASTDRSVEVIRAICPNWDIVPSRNAIFEGYKFGEEVEDYEFAISGWKMVLNTTEFLVIDNLRDYLTRFEESHPEHLGFWIPAFPMVDNRDQAYIEPDSRTSLVKQRTFGFYNTALHNRCCRLIHRDWHGHFDHGRHASVKHRHVMASPSGPNHPPAHSSTRPAANGPYTWEGDQSIFLLWYGFSPFTVRQILRTWQKAEMCPEECHKTNFGNVEGYIIGKYRELSNHTHDLCQAYPLLKKYVDALDYIVEQPLKKTAKYNTPKIAPVKRVNTWG